MKIHGTLLLFCLALFAQAQTTKTPFEPTPSNFPLYYSKKMEGGFWLDSAGYKGFMDKSGNATLTAEYDSIKTICDDFLVYKKNKCGIVTHEGKEVLPTEYDRIRKSTDNYWLTKIGNFWGYKNNVTGFLQTPIYDDIKVGNFKAKEKLWYKKGKKFGFICPNDVVDTYLYDKLLYTHDGGCVSGMTECGFTYIRAFDNTVFIAQKGKKMGLLSIDNEELLPFEYDTIHTFFGFNQYYKPNERIYYQVKQGKKSGILYFDYTTKKTVIVLPIQYDYISFFANSRENSLKRQDRYVFLVKKRSKQGIFNIENEVYVPFRRQIIYVNKMADYISEIIIKI